MSTGNLKEIVPGSDQHVVGEGAEANEKGRRVLHGLEKTGAAPPAPEQPTPEPPEE